MKLPSNLEGSQGYNRHLKQTGLTSLNTVTCSERKSGKSKPSNSFSNGAFRTPQQLSCLRMTYLSRSKRLGGNFSNALRLSRLLKLYSNQTPQRWQKKLLARKQTRYLERSGVVEISMNSLSFTQTISAALSLEEISAGSGVVQWSQNSTMLLFR